MQQCQKRFIEFSNARLAENLNYSVVNLICVETHLLIKDISKPTQVFVSSHNTWHVLWNKTRSGHITLYLNVRQPNFLLCTYLLQMKLNKLL